MVVGSFHGRMEALVDDLEAVVGTFLDRLMDSVVVVEEAFLVGISSLAVAAAAFLPFQAVRISTAAAVVAFLASPFLASFLVAAVVEATFPMMVVVVDAASFQESEASEALVEASESRLVVAVALEDTGLGIRSQPFPSVVVADSLDGQWHEQRWQRELLVSPTEYWQEYQVGHPRTLDVVGPSGTTDFERPAFSLPPFHVALPSNLS